MGLNEEGDIDFTLKSNEGILNKDSLDNSSDLEDVDKRSQEADVKRKEDNNSSRITLRNWVMWLISSYILFILSFIVLISLGILILSDIVLIALLSTTTLNILGLPFIVLRGYFERKL